MNINGVEITDEMLKKANECKNTDELIALAKEYGVELTQEQADAFMDEATDTELSAEALDQISGARPINEPSYLRTTPHDHPCPDNKY